MWCVPDDEWETAEVVWAPDEDVDEAVLGGDEEEVVGEEAVEVAIDERAGIDLEYNRLVLICNCRGTPATILAHNLSAKHAFSYPNFAKSPGIKTYKILPTVLFT